MTVSPYNSYMHPSPLKRIRRRMERSLPAQIDQSNHTLERRTYLTLKRVMDLAIAAAALIVLGPVMVVIALLIRLDSPGPALFRQTRIGRGGRPFRVFKFRSMKDKLDDSSHRAFMQAFVKGDIRRATSGRIIFKPIDKSQITRVGAFLRRTSLDELPQVLNVLKGDMSIVGPRPNVPWEVEAYEDWHMERLAVQPGITGLAQINGRSGLDFDTIVKYDIEYVRKQSLKLDVQILLNTLLPVLNGKGAH
jgi:lipopolysaccharide/colanic/teichoic acid biosynthesis glycosyltransferase